MSVRAYLIGVRNMDGLFERMLEAKRFIDGAGLSYPIEVKEYFGDLIEESESYIREEMTEVILASGGGSGWKSEHDQAVIWPGEDDMEKWAILYVRDIPVDIEALKVKLSW